LSQLISRQRTGLSPRPWQARHWQIGQTILMTLEFYNGAKMNRKISTSLIWFLTLVLAGFALPGVPAQTLVHEPQPARSGHTEAVPQSGAQPAGAPESQTPAARHAQPERAPRPPFSLDNPPSAELLERIEQAIEAARASIPKARDAELLYGESLKQAEERLEAARARIPLMRLQELPDTESLKFMLQQAAGSYHLLLGAERLRESELLAGLQIGVGAGAGTGIGWCKRHSDNPEEELKITALQSLFRADADRGAAVAADLLKPDSKASRGMKEAAISLLGQYRGAQSAPLLESIARSQTDPELRRTAMHWLAERGGPQAVGILIKLYDSEKDVESRQSIVHWLSRRQEPEAAQKLLDIAKNDPSTEVRQSAIHWLANRNNPEAIATLIQLYDSEKNVEVKQGILHALYNRAGKQATGQPGQNAAFDKLMQVAKSDPSVQLRQSALHWIGERSPVETIIQMYDSETNVELKQGLLHSLYNAASRKSADQAAQNAALDKLMQIAKSDPSMELRQSAIHWVGERAGAEVLISLYDSQTNAEIKQSLLHSIAQKQTDAAFRKLVDVARSDSSKELRSSALHWIGQRKGGEGVDALIQIYDSEKNVEIKAAILHSLGQQAARSAPEPSPQKRALKKLFDVARRDSSIELRTQAVHWIGQSKDPEAIKFIEDLLK
jgi:HEAT repeat protein